MNLEVYYDFCVDLAYRAGQITLGYFNTGIRPEFKPDDTPVTAADKAAETFVHILHMPSSARNLVTAVAGLRLSVGSSILSMGQSHLCAEYPYTPS